MGFIILVRSTFFVDTQAFGANWSESNWSGKQNRVEEVRGKEGVGCYMHQCRWGRKGRNITEINESKCKPKTSGFNSSKDDRYRAGEHLRSFLEGREKRSQVAKPGEPEWGRKGDKKQWNMTQVQWLYTRACECFQLRAGQQQIYSCQKHCWFVGTASIPGGWKRNGRPSVGEQVHFCAAVSPGCCSTHRKPRKKPIFWPTLWLKAG